MNNESVQKLFTNYFPKNVKIDQLEDIRFKSDPAWSGEKYELKYPDYYSKDILDIFYRSFHAAIEYLEGNHIKDLILKYSTTMRIITRVARDLISGNTMEMILRSLIGNTEKLGLDLAVADLRIFYAEKERLPKTKEKGMITIRNSVLSNKHWHKFGIKSWEDLLKYAFGEDQLIQMQEAEENQKFNKAINELKRFRETNKRLPLYEDREIKWIASSISRGIWKALGIGTWNDMLIKVFGELNLDQNKYKGQAGFELAIKELSEYKEKNKKLPSATDFDTIKNVIYRGEWKNHGINKWNDLLILVFGEVHFTIENDFHEKDSLQKAQEQLKLFKSNYGRLPKSKDKEIVKIAGASNHGAFKDQNIRTWNDLLKATFGEVNQEPYKYTGRKGLDKAIQDLKDYKNKNGKKPISADMDTIYKIIREGGWKAYGINTWNDILLSAFGEVHLDREKYRGKKGLDLAIHEMKNFKKATGIMPTSVSDGMIRIYNAVQRGEWMEYGIKKWTDLLYHVFNEIHVELYKYVGKEGLDRAIHELKLFQDKMKRIPSLRDPRMAGINSAISRNTWTEFGISKWNDLLNLTFGQINRDLNKYHATEGLKRAIQILKSFFEKYRKKPTPHDPGIPGIYTAIRRGEWKKERIYSWKDLLDYAEKNGCFNHNQLNLETFMRI